MYIQRDNDPIHIYLRRDADVALGIVQVLELLLECTCRNKISNIFHSSRKTIQSSSIKKSNVILNYKI